MQVHIYSPWASKNTVIDCWTLWKYVLDDGHNTQGIDPEGEYILFIIAHIAALFGSTNHAFILL